RALDNLYDEGGLFVWTDGSILDKKHRIPLSLDKTVRLQTSRATPRSIRTIGAVTVESGKWAGSGQASGKPFQMWLAYTGVWIKKDGRWVITAEQLTDIPATKGH